MMLLIEAGSLAIFLAAGWLWPRARAPLFGRDTRLNLLTGGVLFALRTLVLMAIGTWTGPRLIPLSSLTHPALQLLLVFVVGDLARYWLHRAHHEVGFLWQFHRVHHSSEHLNATSGLRMHAIDFLQLSLLPALLFGLLLDTSSFDPRVWIALGSIIAAMDAFQHADLRFPLSNPVARAWYRVFNTPHFHSWHHVRDWTTHHGNYGQTLVLWDRWFGTAVDAPGPAVDLGLTSDQALAPTLLGQQLLRREPTR
jgi:sterol desaturase/sphingolipid hydroxylase (fatty acid hydroxylase superfamily)